MIKQICETELGIVSQCCEPKQAAKLNKQYLEILTLKINVKVGGRNTVLNDGIQRNIPLVADVWGSVDWPEFTKYRGLVCEQTAREEIIQDLYTYEEGLRPSGYRGMFRDGVSEGQFSQVLLFEVDAIRKPCASLQEGYQPRITFVVVQRRHHTCLFPADHNSRDQMDRSGNIQPGTVVDTKICHPTEFDFYLNSHA